MKSFRNEIQGAKSNVILPATVESERLEPRTMQRLKRLVNIYSSRQPTNTLPSRYCLDQRSHMEALVSSILAKRKTKESDERVRVNITVAKSCELPKVNVVHLPYLRDAKKSPLRIAKLRLKDSLEKQHNKISVNPNTVRKNYYSNFLKEQEKRIKRIRKRTYDTTLLNAMNKFKDISSSVFSDQINKLLQKLDNINYKHLAKRNKGTIHHVRFAVFDQILDPQ